MVPPTAIRETLILSHNPFPAVKASGKVRSPCRTQSLRPSLGRLPVHRFKIGDVEIIP